MAEKTRNETAADEELKTLRERLKACELLLIGLGSEWEKAGGAEVQEAYRALASMTEGKDYFIVTTAKDARIFESSLDEAKITAPCGNVNWLQCSKGCTKDIWERGEVADGICPHCGAPLTENTVLANPYIEEGYLKSWNLYREWLAGTLNHALLILELGVDFKTPTVIRWNREKFAAWNLSLIEGRAPAALEALPAPDAVFIGGTKGNMAAVVDTVLAKNANARICIAAIALESLSAAIAALTAHGLSAEVTQLAVSRARPAGRLHLLTANNPIFLITGERK